MHHSHKAHMQEELEPEEQPRNWGGRRPGARRKPHSSPGATQDLRNAMMNGARNSDYQINPAILSASSRRSRTTTLASSARCSEK
jgi:hypothetical protein